MEQCGRDIFLFHFVTGWQSAWPVIRRAINDVGLQETKPQYWANPLPLLGLDTMRVFETLVLDAGLLLTLYLAWRIALVYAPRAQDALRLLAPWAGVAIALYCIGVWIFLQPMQMRGMPNLIPRL